MVKKSKTEYYQKRVSAWSLVAFKRLRISFTRSIGGILWGFLFGIVVAILTWLFAYFGYTDLGLPQRFDFEQLDHVVRNEIPNNYDYTIKQVRLRSSTSDSLIVVARNKDYADITKKDTESDILLVLDKTEKAYGVAYKFKPTIEGGVLDSAIHAVNVSTADLNGDERQDLVVGWSYVGANYSPPYITVFTANASNTVGVSSLPRLHNYAYPATYQEPEFINAFDKNQIVKVAEVYSYYLKQGSLLTAIRDDTACHACSDEQIYNLNSFSLYNGRLVEAGMPVMGINGYDALKEYVEKNGYTR